MLSAFIGRMGQGKTLGMTAVAVEHRTNSLQTAMENLHGWDHGSITFAGYADDVKKREGRTVDLTEYIQVLEEENLDDTYPRLLESIARYSENPHKEHSDMVLRIITSIEEGRPPESNEIVASVIKIPLENYSDEFVKLSPIEQLICLAALTPKENLLALQDLETFSENLYYARPVRIFATYHLVGIKYEYIDLDKFSSIMQSADGGSTVLHNCLFLIDEAYLFFDSRTSMSKQNRMFNAFISQTRKRGVDVYITTHTIDKVDRRVRGAIHFQVACRFNPKTQTSHMTVQDLQRGKVALKSIYGPVIYPFFDTNEIVQPQGKMYKLSQEYTS